MTLPSRIVICLLASALMGALAIRATAQADSIFGPPFTVASNHPSFKFPGPNVAMSSRGAIAVAGSIWSSVPSRRGARQRVWLVRTGPNGQFGAPVYLDGTPNSLSSPVRLAWDVSGQHLWVVWSVADEVRVAACGVAGPCTRSRLVGHGVEPRVALDNHARAVVLWIQPASRGKGLHDRLRWRRVTAKQFGPTETVGNDGPLDEGQVDDFHDPDTVRLAADGNGNLWAAWVSFNRRPGADPRHSRYVGMMRVARLSTRPSTPRTFLTPRRSATDVQLAVGPDGEVVVAWRDAPSASEDATSVGPVYVAERPPGGHFRDARLISANTLAHGLKLSLGGDKRALLVWEAYGGDPNTKSPGPGSSEQTVFASVREPGGSFSPPIQIGQAGHGCCASAAVDATGNAIIAWGDSRGLLVEMARPHATFGQPEIRKLGCCGGPQPSLTSNGFRTFLLFAGDTGILGAIRPS